MRTKLEFHILIALALLAGCTEPDEQDPAAQAPAPIGDPLMSIEGAWSDCGGGIHLYRAGRQLQSQCFDPDGAFVYENHGSLTSDAAATLDSLLAASDPSDTEPVNHQGLCGAADALATVNVWVAGERVAFDQGCIPNGVLPVYEHTMAAWTELSSCGEQSPTLLESIEAGCRTH